MKRVLAALLFCAAAMIPTAGSALADNVHLFTNMTGQPDSGGSIVNCGSGAVTATSTGNSNPTNAGSPFTSNPNGTIAGSHYAGSAPQNSNNPNSISQYDVACFQTTMHMNR
jgi:hypothetical protein